MSIGVFILPVRARAPRRALRQAATMPLCVLVCIAAPSLAQALTCAHRPHTLLEAYEAADSIIVGQVSECRKETSGEPYTNGGADCSFSSLEVLKESTPARDYSGTASSAPCGLSLHPGDQYLLFLDNSNQPLQFSAALDGDPQQVKRASEYLQTIRAFREGHVDQLAEPWLFHEYDGRCTVFQNVGGNSIRFTRIQVPAPQPAAQPWVRETINGRRVYKSTFPAYSTDFNQLLGQAEIIAYGEAPDYGDNTLLLIVDLQEEAPAPLRHVSLSVGSESWLLNRVETHFTMRDVTLDPIVDYQAAGTRAEEILSAMMPPSDVVVTATIVRSEPDPASPPEALQPGRGTFERAPQQDSHITRTMTPGSPASQAVAQTARSANSYRTPRELAPPVLRVESRSDNLSKAIRHFSICTTAND